MDSYCPYKGIESLMFPNELYDLDTSRICKIRDIVIVVDKYLEQEK